MTTQRFEYCVTGKHTEFGVTQVNNLLNEMASKGWRYVGPDGCGRDVFEREVQLKCEGGETGKRGGKRSASKQSASGVPAVIPTSAGSTPAPRST